MKRLAFLFIAIVILAFTACEPPPCNEEHNNVLVKEVEKRYNNLINLAYMHDFVTFKDFLDDDVTVMTEGYWIPPDSIAAYVFEVFENLAHDSVETNKTAYDVVCCHSTAIYQRILASYNPVDTVRGCATEMMLPLNLKITTEESSTKDEDYDAGIETMQIRPVDTVGNNALLLKPVKRLIPVKTMAVSIVWDKGKESWKMKHIHVSLGLKRTSVYLME